MCIAQCVLVVALLVGLAHSWDIALTVGDRIEFYTEYGTKIETVRLPSQNLTSLVYDEVHNMLLYVDQQNNNDAICGYNITFVEYKCYVERNGRSFHGLAFDPATETLFFTATDERSIYTFSFKHGSTNNVHGNLLIQLDNGMPTDIAVDSCRGYIYWINIHLPRSTIERARFDGSGREVIIHSESAEALPYLNDIDSVAIDQQTRQLIWTMPWTTYYTYTFSTDLNGNNRNKIITWGTSTYNLFPNTFTFFKHELYSVTCSNCPMKTVYKYTKPSYRASKITDVHFAYGVAIATNYKMREQFYGISECSHLLNNNYGIDESFKIAKEHEGSCCVHGTKVSGQSLCKCAPGYSGDRCEISVCENYCFQGKCSFTEQGQPTCRCEVGFSGARCEVNMCTGHCLNSGTCFLNEEDEAACECVGEYEGDRCEVPKVQNQPAGQCTLNHLGEAEKSLTLADLLENYRQRNNIH